jgi:hypothetical protein
MQRHWTRAKRLMFAVSTIEHVGAAGGGEASEAEVEQVMASGVDDADTPFPNDEEDEEEEEEEEEDTMASPDVVQGAPPASPTSCPLPPGLQQQLPVGSPAPSSAKSVRWTPDTSEAGAAAAADRRQMWSGGTSRSAHDVMMVRPLCRGRRQPPRRRPSATHTNEQHASRRH